MQDDIPPMRGLGAVTSEQEPPHDHDQVVISLMDPAPILEPKPPVAEVPQDAREQAARRAQTSANLDENSFPALPTPAAAQPPVLLQQKKTTVAVPKTVTQQTRKAEAKKTELKNEKPNLLQPIQEKKAPRPLDILKSEASATEVPKIEPRSPAETPRLENKRRHPGKLDIEAAMKPMQVEEMVPEQQDSKVSTPVRAAKDQSMTPLSSAPPTPGLTIETQAKRSAQPRTLRVTSTPKAETPATPGAASTPIIAAQQILARASPAPSRRGSRRPSLASAEPDDMLISETIPDTASVTTGTYSRANSPPPLSNRVGSAPVRSKTKSQAKKDRLERARAISEDQSIADLNNFQVDSVEHAPILGRKTKKTRSKKTAATSATRTSTPDVSRPVSPGTSALEETPETDVVQEDAQKEYEGGQSVEDPPEASIEDVLEEAKSSKPNPSSPAAIIHDLQESGELEADFMKLFLEPLLRVSHGRPDPLTVDDIWSMATPKTLTSAEVAALNRGEAVRREGHNNRASSRLMISPTKKCLPRLTKELEDRYLELEKRVLDSRPPYKYTHQRKQDAKLVATIDDMLRDMTAILTRPPKAANTTRATTAPAQPVAKSSSRRSGPNTDSTKPQIQPPPQPSYASDALAYLNQFILPPLPSAPRPNPLKPQTATMPNATTSSHVSAATPMAPPVVAATGQTVPGTAIPRTYTTGDPTYSVSGIGGANSISQAPPQPPPAPAVAPLPSSSTALDIQKLIHGDFGKLTQSDIRKLRKEDIDNLSPADISALAQNAANAAAAAVGDLRNLNLGGDVGPLRSADFEKIQSLGSKALKGQTLSGADMASLKSLGISGTTGFTSGSVSASASAEAIKTALANAVNGVVQAAAAVASVGNAPTNIARERAQAQIQAAKALMEQEELQMPAFPPTPAISTATPPTSTSMPPPSQSLTQQLTQTLAQAQGQLQAKFAQAVQTHGPPGQAAQQPLPRKVLNEEEAQKALAAAKEESKAYEKRMAALVRRNRKAAGIVA